MNHKSQLTSLCFFTVLKLNILNFSFFLDFSHDSDDSEDISLQRYVTSGKIGVRTMLRTCKKIGEIKCCFSIGVIGVNFSFNTTVLNT